MTNWLVRQFIKNNQEITKVSVRSAYGNLAGVVGIVCNVLLCVGKIVVGSIFGSISIVADGVNNLSDAASNFITILGFRFSEKPADEEHPYGHARLEYIAGIAVSILIFLIGFELAQSSISKLIHPVPIAFSWLMMAVLLVSIAVKLWMTYFNHTIGQKIDSAALRAAALDSRNDVIATAAVLFACCFSAWTGINLDGWVGLLVSLLIFYSGIVSLKDTVNPLLGQAPSEEVTQEIARIILGYEGVLGTHDLMMHDYGPGRRFASVHVEMAAEEDVMKSHDIIDNIERYFHEEKQIHLVIHYDPIVTGDAAVGSKREWVKRMVQEISNQLSIHDFRMVQGVSHTNLIFDVLVPHSFHLSDAVLRSKIQQAVQESAPAGETYYTVITIDHSFAPYHEDEEKGILG